MNAKTRYRQRLKLQAALTRLMQVLIENHCQGIPPDRTTAIMAGPVIANLIQFATAAGLKPEEVVPAKFDVTRFVAKAQAKAKERQYRRAKRRTQF